MDYEKAYKEALEDIEEILSSGQDSIKMSRLKLRLQGIFPELKESEDERIRTHIIEVFRDNFSGEDTDRCVAWLEKQSVQKPNPYTGTSFEYNGHTFGMCARDNGVEILFDGELKAFVSSEKSFVYPIHPQPDFAPKNAMEAIKEEKVDNANKIEPKDYSSIDPYFGKPADKVEPKFKVGDWVVNKFGDSWHIDSFDKKNYQVSDGIGNYNYFPIAKQEEMHLWTIQDAKDGDVLQLGEVTAIFKEFIGNNNCKCYCSAYNGEFEIPSQEGVDNSYGCYNATPATKEQRDLLFQKMKEAGYKWDAEKKGLKKIHVIDEGKAEMDYCFTKMMNGEKVSSAWSEEDTFKVQRICKYLNEAKKYYADITEVRECMDWLKSLKERIQPQPKQEWSEEDETALCDALWCCKQAASIAKDENDMGNIWYAENWLKSLKERVQPQWKPEDIHLEALRCVINGNNLDIIALKDLLEQLRKL